jgi:hypothetical protein
MANAAGGTNQRLNPSPAMMRSLDKKPGVPLAVLADVSTDVLMLSPLFFGCCASVGL